MRRLLGGLLIAGGLVPQIALAAGTTGADFLRTLITADAAGVAAGAAGSGGSEQLAWNPAGLLGAADPSLSFTHFSALADTAYEQIEGVLPDWLEGAWAARLFYDATYDFTEIDAFGSEVGALDNHDLLAEVAYARDLGAGWQAGLAVKGFESALAGFHSYGAAVDAGVRYRTSWAPLALGAVLQNAGAMSAFDAVADPLPLAAVLGAALAAAPFEGHRLDLLADLNLPLAGDLQAWPAAGLEYRLREAFRFRGGYRFVDGLGKLSLGAGVSLGNLDLDYAYQPYAALGSTHRFTLSYVFRPAPPAEPAPTPVPPAPVAAAAPEPVSLTALPRPYEAQVTFRPPRGQGRDLPRQLAIRTEDGRVVKTFSGTVPLPKDVVWDGRDSAGRSFLGEERFRFVFQEGNSTIAYDLPKVAPAWKLRFADRTALAPEARFVFTERPPLRAWTLTIYAKEGGAEKFRMQGEGELPGDRVWDGKGSDGKLEDPSRTYAYRLEVVYPDGAQAGVAGDLHPIAARAASLPDAPALAARVKAGDAALLILDIRFDFNRAELKPEMTDKVMAAAEILRSRPGRAWLTCEGHADEIGSAPYNQSLSERRARMVGEFLAKQPGVPAGSVELLGYGQSRPENSKGTDEGRAANRRVELRVVLTP
jgi:outer membrane protein OmpA-like peptidoglycan-associated protein